MNFLRVFRNALILNKFLLTWIVSCLGLFWFMPCVAADSADTAKLLQLLGGTQTMQASFVQTVLDKNGAPKVGQNVTGTMALQRPGKFRWEVLQPQHQLIVANNNHVWVYDADLQQVTKQALDAGESGNPAQLLSGDNTALRSTFTVKNLNSTDDNSNANCFALSPKNKNNMYSKVTLCFDESKLSSMVMDDNLGQSSKFMFSKTVINSNLASALFVFTPPKGVDVIDNN